MSKNRRKKKKGCAVHNWKYVKEITLGNKIFIQSRCSTCMAIKNREKKERNKYEKS